jgi:DNA processing protein
MLDDVNTLTFSDDGFPSILRPIATPPERIYWRGQSPKNWLSRPKVAVVGSRKMTAYGHHITEKLVTELSRRGVIIISGLAYGIDVTAHKAALAARGATVAVLPSGLDSVYPAAHFHIARQIAETGTLITEYAQGTPTYPANFIARNRLISGLCDVLLITEAALKSGSLHTARFALEQGKTVMAVPGNINNPSSEGSNNLIKSGAVPVTSADDIFFALKIKPAKDRNEMSFSGQPHEEMIFQLIREGVCAQEELAVAAELEGPLLSSTLTMLEISGHIRPAGGGKWVIA